MNRAFNYESGLFPSTMVVLYPSYPTTSPITSSCPITPPFSGLNVATSSSSAVINDCNICNQYYYYRQNISDSSTFVAPSFPTHLTSNYYSLPQCYPSMVNSFEDQFASSYPQDDTGRYPADGCWYPNSSYRKVYGSIYSQGQQFRNLNPDYNTSDSYGELHQEKKKRSAPMTAKDIFKRTLRTKLFPQDPIEKIYAKFHTPRLPTERPILLGQKPSRYSQGLEIVWNQQFNYLFRYFPEDFWTFGPLNVSEEKVSDWTIFRDMAKVRFCCRKCKHGWTSMHGPVVFYYLYEDHVRKGNVRFILTGQKCIECKSQDFETPMWYPEEAQKVITNLYYEIASKIYRKAMPPLIKDRRHGRPRQQHVATDCQGCHLGICKPKPENNKSA